MQKSALSRELDFLRAGLPTEHNGIPAPIRISVVGDQLELNCGTSALMLNSLLKVQDERQGTVAIRASVFRQLISQLPNDTVTLDMSRGRLSVEWPSGHASLPEQMLPVFDASLGGNASMFRLPAKALGALLAGTKPAWTEKQYTIPGVLLEFGNKNLRLVAVDGYSMAIIDHPVDTADIGTALLPNAGLQSMVSMLADADGPAVLTIGDKCVCLVTSDRSVVVRIAVGKFPTYQKIVPPTHATPVIMHRADLIEAVRRVVLTGDDAFAQVSFICRRDAVTLHSEVSREEFSAEYAGDDTEIRFDAKRLGRILSALSSERVAMYAGADRLPAMFKPQGDESTTFVLVPIRK